VGNAVNHSDFKAAFQGCQNKHIGTPYRFCAFLALPAVDSWRRRSSRRKPVALIFESGNRLMNEYGRMFAQLGTFDRLREKFGIASITEGSKKEMPPLQAADLIAYATYKCLVQHRIEGYLETAFEALFKIQHVGVLHGNPDLVERALRKMDAL
jgi:hypothetical protein